MLNPPFNQKPTPLLECYPERTHIFEIMKDENLHRIIQHTGCAYYDARDQTVVVPKSGVDYLLESPEGKNLLTNDALGPSIKIEILNNYAVDVRKGKVHCIYQLTQESADRLDLSETADFILTVAEGKFAHVVVGVNKFGAAFFDLPAEITSTGSGVAVVPPIQGDYLDKLYLMSINKHIKTPEGGLRRDQMYMLVSGRQTCKSALFQQLRELIDGAILPEEEIVRRVEAGYKNGLSEAFVDRLARAQDDQRNYRRAGVGGAQEDAAVEKLSQPYKKKNNMDALTSRRYAEIARRARLLASFPFTRKQGD
jgi:hypothetical protein